MTSVLSTPGGPEPTVVVGGGVVGLATAWELARRGEAVLVVDPGQRSSRASWAAGGMLAPLGEAQSPGAFLDFGLESLALYPTWVRDIESRTGRQVGLALDGKLLVALTEDDEARLRARLSWLQDDARRVRWLDSRETLGLEPRLASGLRGSVLLEGNGRVNNRALQEALEEAVALEGVATVRDRVRQVTREEDRVTGVTLASGESLSAGRVIVCAGAWSTDLMHLPPEAKVTPVKGQMLAFAAPHRPLRHVVTTPRVYLIPRESATGPVVVAGATEERTGFERAVTDEAQGGLEVAARELLPELASAPVTERWAGLRPGTPDGHPVIGPHPEIEGLWMATGHFRNGILLAPATARAVASQLTGSDDRSPSPFRPERFRR